MQPESENPLPGNRMDNTAPRLQRRPQTRFADRPIQPAALCQTRCRLAKSLRRMTLQPPVLHLQPEVFLRPRRQRMVHYRLISMRRRRRFHRPAQFLPSPRSRRPRHPHQRLVNNILGRHRRPEQLLRHLADAFPPLRPVARRRHRGAGPDVLHPAAGMMRQPPHQH